MANMILFVDTIRAFYDVGNLRNPLMENIIDNMVQLAERKQREGWKLYFLADNHQPDDKEFKMFPPHAIIGTAETELILQLVPFLKNDRRNYISKNRFSGFFQTRLETILEAERPDIVIVVGVCTDICIKYTVEELRNRGYRVQVIADCVTTYDIPLRHDAKEVNRYELQHMQDILGAEIIPTQAEA